MKHPTSQHLYTYWDLLRGGRAAPERSDIDPAAIRSVLADTLMIDVEPGAGLGSNYPIRLSGTRVNALFGADLKGRNFPSLWRLGDSRDVAALVSDVLDGTRPLVAGIVAGPPGEPSINLELVLLPLRHKGKTHARVLAALSPVAVPSWLGLVPVAPLALHSYRVIDPQAPRSVFAPRDPQPAHHGGTRHGQFVIHQGGRA